MSQITWRLKSARYVERMRRCARSTAAATVLTALAFTAACSRDVQKPNAREATDGKDSAAVSSMPGMNMSSDTPYASKAGAGSGSVTFTPAQVAHGKIRWQAASMSTASASVTVPGQLVANEDRTSRLGAPAGGRVLAVRVQPGDRVSEGQVLVTLQSPAAGMAQADVAKARAEVTSRLAQARYARAARERAERLLTLKAMPRQDYERAVADDDAAGAALAQAEAEGRRASSTANQLGANSSASGEIVIRSPLAGVVLARTAVPGSVIDVGAPLVVVIDPSSLWLQVNAPEQYASLFHRGGQLRFTVPAYPADTFNARVDAVGAGLDPATRTLPVRGVVPSGGKLKAEMFATVVVEGAGMVPAVVLPDDAVQQLDGKTVVFIATPDSKGGARFDPRTVIVGSRARGKVAVTRGLAAGDVVVTEGAFAIKAQLKKGSMPDMEM
jgi:cobalt-zinc-cadmium efflux system membrane fusion protein